MKEFGGAAGTRPLPERRGCRATQSFIACTFLVAGCAILTAQDPAPTVTLEQAASRTGPDFTPAYEGRSVHIRAQVAEPPVWAVGSYLVSVIDAQGYGLMLRGGEKDFAGLSRGDWIEAEGTIQLRGGMPMLVPDIVQRTGRGTLPSLPNRSLAELTGFRYLALPVQTTAIVISAGANTGGKLVGLRDGEHNLTAFLPNTPGATPFDVSHLHPGDRVRIRGVAMQYDVTPPYNGNYQILVGGPSGIEVVETGPPAPPWVVAVIALMVVLALSAWWLRERRVNRQRSTVKAFHALVEEIIAATSPGTIAERLEEVVPAVLGATAVELFLFHRQTKSLERVPTPSAPEPMAAAVDAPPDGLANAAVACFRNLTVLSVPDVRRNPLVKAGAWADLPRSAIFLPLLAGAEPLGVLELDNHRRVGYFSPEDQAAAQHLANQVAASLRLQAQQAMREQLFRSEKLAATGQLISGVAGELKAPLDRIVQLAEARAGRAPEDIALKELCLESHRVEGIVSRLVSFTGADGAPENPGSANVDVHAVLNSLVQFREHEWRGLGVRVTTRLSTQPAVVAAVRGHIEQVFLNLLVHAQQRTMEGGAKNIAVQTSVMAGKLLVEIVYSAPPLASEAPDGPLQPGQASAMGLGVCHVIAAGLGGEIRLRALPGLERFEVELPLSGSREPGAAAQAFRSQDQSTLATRPLTLMLVDTDTVAQRQLVASLGSRGHRVVPALASEAPELAQRLRFDAVFWAVRTGGGRWSEYHERLRNTVSAFVLLSDGYDHHLARSLEANGGFLLSTPIGEAEADRVLAEIAMRAPVVAR
jgi:signal transduction histidine kinase